MAGATGLPQVSNSAHLQWQHPLPAAIEAKGRFGALATPDVPGTRYISGTGPPGNETAAPTGIESGGREKEIKDDGRPSKSSNSHPQVWSLHRGRSRASVVRVVRDDASQLFRIAWPDIGLSASANLTRCKDAAREWAESAFLTEHRKKSGARRLKSLDNFSWSSSPVRLNGGTPVPAHPCPFQRTYARPSPVRQGGEVAS